MNVVYTHEQIQFIKQNVTGRSIRQLTELFNKKFRASVTVYAMMGVKRRHGLRSGYNTYFKTGNIPHNKGTKKPRVKKLHHYNGYPIGTERINTHGYVEMKVSDRKGYQNWMYKHRLIWEQANGSIPLGYKVIFADKNKQNFSLDNLMLVSKSELTVMNSRGLITTNSDYTKIGKAVASLKLAITKRKIDI